MRKRFFLALLLIPLFIGFQTASAASVGTSSNWAGYAATSGTFTAVGGSWTVPQSTGSDADLSADATWVGIGGVSGTDLIQAGTQDIIQNGTSTYEAWYEILPASSVAVPLTVHPNDGITISIVQQSSGQWQISFNDTTTGQSYQISVSYTSSLSSAEWIEEMPSDQQGLVALDDFGKVSFVGGFAVQNGSQVSISGSGAQPMTMITGNGQSLATPSALGADGASFTVTRTDAVAASTVSMPSPGEIGGWSRTGIGIRGYMPSPHQSQARTQFQPQPQIIERSFSKQFRSMSGIFGDSARATVQSLQKIEFRNIYFPSRDY